MTGAGLLLVDKGPGVTSFQVVAHVRRRLAVDKVGHGGTLDPLATGVLPLLLGGATRFAPYLLTRSKEYVATLRLGVATDTLDATGRVTAERPVPALTEAAIGAVLARFVGEIEQVPPMFSALHVGGRRLHELARAGLEVERAPRRVRIDAISLTALSLPHLTIRVACGTGTYVRSLAADVGTALSTCAHITALQRTRLGEFRLEDAVPWDLVRQGDPAALWPRVLPADRAVEQLPPLFISRDAAERLYRGQRVAGLLADAGTRELCRLYSDRDFLGIGELGPDGLRPVRMLDAGRPRARSVSP